MTIAIDYEITGSGWAHCDVSSDAATCKVTASYLSDALGGMVLAAIALLKGFPAVSFRFEEEPGEYRWSIRQRDGEAFDLRIYWFEDTYESDADEAGEEIFSMRCGAVEFGDAVYGASKRVLDKYGEAGYLEKWVEDPFPVHLMHALREQLQRRAREVR